MKSDKKLTVPNSAKDLQALLDNSGYMNQTFPAYLGVVSDEYYVADSRYTSMRPIDAKNNYTWSENAYYDAAWISCYQAIYYANTALDYVDKVSGSTFDLDRVKGGGYFFRAVNYLVLSQIYCPAYSITNASLNVGLPLRANSDFNNRSIRSTLQQTYDQIVSDFSQAAEFLPNDEKTNFRPTKAAAYAGLARAYLYMGRYAEAKEAADKYLSLRSSLIDLKALLPGQQILRDNVENIFFAGNYGPAALNPSQAFIDSNLIKLYAANDLRLKCFYRRNADKTYDFIGGYDGFSPSSFIYQGFATDEIYLIRAESLARAGNISDAMKDVNTLLKNRYDLSFVPLQAVTVQEALEIILKERRKELVYRGIRWSDVKRLNIDTPFQTTLRRDVAGKTYLLSPNDPKYVLLIPEDVIRLSGIEQNQR